MIEESVKVVVLFTQSSKSTYSVPIKFVLNKVIRLKKKKNFSLIVFFLATRYPGLRKLLEHTIRDRF